MPPPLALRLALLFCLSLLGSTYTAVAQTERLTTASNVRLTLNNLGMIGNAFRNSYQVLGYPSCEYPAGSGIEHLFQGGPWIGAKKNGQTLVSTGSFDAGTGYTPGACNFEFTAKANAPINTISSLVRNPGYNPFAISHQDFIMDFTDTNLRVPGTTIIVNRGCSNGSDAPHNPLGLTVHMETYNWNFSFANYFVILNTTYKNVSKDTLKDVAAGYWADYVVRNVRRTPAGSGGSGYFDKGANGFIDSLYMAYQFDAIGDIGFTDSYIALKFLGAQWSSAAGVGKDSTNFYHPARTIPYTGYDTAFKVNYNVWSFNGTNPNFFTPRSEQDRYLRLVSGQNQRADWESFIRPTIRGNGNRVTLLSQGPIPRLAPGETLNVAYALVLAKKTDDAGRPAADDTPKQKQALVNNASWAQVAFNGEDVNFNGLLDAGEDQNGDNKLTRYVLPAPPDIPLTRIETGLNSATLYWADNSEKSIDPITRRKDFAGYRVYKTRTGFDVSDVLDIGQKLELYSSLSLKGNLGIVSPLPPKATYMFDGDTITYNYKLEIPNLPAGWQHGIAISAYDSGNAATNLPSLESSKLDALFRVFPGTPANKSLKDNKPFVYPNPYYGAAAWERPGAAPEERKLMFANLPANCRIRITTQAGDLVDDFEHNGASYKGQGSRWYEDNADTATNQLSGGEHPWDLLSSSTQIIARGVYLFVVEDIDTKKTYRGTFTIIK